MNCPKCQEEVRCCGSTVEAEWWECGACGFEFLVPADPECVAESKAAARDEDAAHGFDFDDDHKVDPNTGMSEYDFDPGISYNDGGEPQGYM